MHELKRLPEDAMPNLDEDIQDKILFQQLLAGLPDELQSRAKGTCPAISDIHTRLYIENACKIFDCF